MSSALPTTTTADKPATTKPWLTRVLAVAIASAAAMGTALGLYGFHADTFHHSNALILRQLAAATNGVHLSLSEKKTSGGTTYEGYLFPRTTETGDLTFDGRISYIYRGSEFNFTLLDDRGYMTIADEATGSLMVSRCMTAGELPPVSTFTSALLDARVVDDSSSDFGILCQDGKLVEIEFAGEPFVFCSSASSNVSSIHGADIEAAIEFLEESSTAAPSLSSLVPSSLNISTCELVNKTTSSETSLTSTARRFLTKSLQHAEDTVRVVKGEPRRSLTAQADSCGCTSKKVCVFVHGFGRSSGATTTSDEDYWGDIHEDATCCSTTYFLHLDTTNLAWYDDSLTSAFCSAALSLSGGSSAQSIANVAVVAHSMGNLIVASAFQKGTCALASTSKWIALSPPMYGSQTVTKLLTKWSSISSSIQNWICTDNESSLDDALYQMFASLGLCGTRASISSLPYVSSSKSTTDLNTKFAQAVAVYVAKVTNVMCGINSYGITSTDSAKMLLVDEFSDHASDDNDGVVEYASCRGGLSADQFDGDWDDGGGFYRANINHRDTTFRHGNAVLGDSRKPVKWFNCQFN